MDAGAGVRFDRLPVKALTSTISGHVFQAAGCQASANTGSVHSAGA